MRRKLISLFLCCWASSLLPVTTSAFTVARSPTFSARKQSVWPKRPVSSSPSCLWWSWSSRPDNKRGGYDDTTARSNDAESCGAERAVVSQPSMMILKAMASIILMAAATTSTALPAEAVSGGGLDYAGTDISGKDFANGNYKGKDFTQVIAKTTTFENSNLQGCRFYKAYLVKTNFNSADLRGASLEDTSMDDATLRNAIAAGAYFSSSLADAQDLQNVDFTDAQIPIKTLPLLCQREDVKGTNPVTGVDTRESLMCP